MIQPPRELLPYVQGNHLTLADGAISDVGAAAAYLQNQQNLTHIALSEAVYVPQAAPNMTGYQSLALAVQRGRSPNLLEVSIAGGHYAAQLAAIVDGNYRAAAELLRLARDPSHALSKNECERIAERLPAMLAVAEARGAVSTEHSMTREQVADTLVRIKNHACQHGVEVGVDEPIARLRPAVTVTEVERAPTLSASLTR